MLVFHLIEGPNAGYKVIPPSFIHLRAYDMSVVLISKCHTFIQFNAGVELPSSDFEIILS